VQHLHADDAKVVLQQAMDNIARRAFFNRVGLDDERVRWIVFINSRFDLCLSLFVS
jgi:hypothetical protein